MRRAFRLTLPDVCTYARAMLRYDRLVNNTNPLVAFAPITAAGQPNLMSKRLSDKIDVLAQTVAGDSRFAGLQIYVISSYVPHIARRPFAVVRASHFISVCTYLPVHHAPLLQVFICGLLSDHTLHLLLQVLDTA